MTFRKARNGSTAVVLGLCFAAACGGQSNKPKSSDPTGGTSGAATAGSTGATDSEPGGAPAGGSTTGGRAGSAATAGSGGTTTECEPGSPPSCDEGELVECDASGSLVRTACGDYQECSPEGGAKCVLSDLPLGTEENEFGFAWRDAFMLLPCYEVQVYDCLTVPSGQVCPNQDVANWEDKGLILTETFEIGGELDAVYSAHLVVNGIVSGKYYQGGVRDRGNDFSEPNATEGSDAFHRGGAPIPSSYDAWQITVRRASGELFGHYYLNSYPQASGFESHTTLPLGYEKDIEVPGGGTIEYRVHDANCRAVNNCGQDSGCNAPRPVPNEPGLMLPESWQGQPLASYNAVTGDQQPFHAQIVHLRVTEITYLRELPPSSEELCEFADPDLQSVVAAALFQPPGPIPVDAAAGVTSLNLSAQGIESLAGIECLANLVSMTLAYDPGAAASLDFSPLAELDHLQSLDLSGNQLVSISSLASLPDVRTLTLSNNLIADLAPLSALSTLVTLDITDNRVTSLTPLVGLANLQALHAVGNLLDCVEQSSTLEALCTQLLEYGEWHVECGAQPSSNLDDCDAY